MITATSVQYNFFLISVYKLSLNEQQDIFLHTEGITFLLRLAKILRANNWTFLYLRKCHYKQKSLNFLQNL